MNTDPTNTPDLWSIYLNVYRIPGSPDPGEWIDTESSKKLTNDSPGSHIVVWHWHRPTEGPARWMGARLSSHTIHSTEPETLHFEPSLGCFAGCPSHGWVRDGHWIDLE
jgi:hypothetical protein